MGLFRRGHSDEALSATEWMHRGADLLDGDRDAAADCYRKALALDDTLRGAWFDLGLVHKWRQEWAESLRCNQRAAALPSQWDDDEEQADPAYWNAGIAATALRDWEAARWAWRGYGIDIGDGEGPIHGDFGPGVVRLPGGETVWGRRIDPTRMKLLSVPLPDSGFRHGDIVLHDGEPKGSRVSGGREYPVFDVLTRWEASSVPTVEVVVEGDAASVAELSQALEAGGVRTENWTSSVALHCVACSMGRLDYDSPDHGHEAPCDDHRHTVGCSGELSVVTGLVETWAASCGAVVHRVEEVA